MDDWFHKHLTQILFCFMSEAGVRWWGKDLSQHSSAARHGSYLETKWAAGMGSSSSICTYYSSDMFLRVFMIVTASHKRVLKSPWVTGKYLLGRVISFSLTFNEITVPHWSPAPQKRWRSLINRCCSSTLNSSDKNILLILFLFTLTQILPQPLQGLHIHLLPHACVLLQHFVREGQKLWPGKWNAKYKKLPLPASQAGMRMPCRNLKDHTFLGHSKNVWHCGTGSGAAVQRENRTPSGDTKTGASWLQRLLVVRFLFLSFTFRISC